MRRAERLFQIIQILRRSARPVTAVAMAAELEVSTRTVYRDMADLIGQRVPVTGEAGLGYVLDAEYDMPPLMLTPDEIEAVVLGAQWVAERNDRLLSPAARDVIAKITAVVPEHRRPFIAAPTVAARPNLEWSDDEWIDTSGLRRAIREGLKLRLRYRAEGEEETERTVWPVILGYAESGRMLIAWCELRQGFRHFRTDRMKTAQVLDVAIGLRSGELRRRWQDWRAAELEHVPLRSLPLLTPTRGAQANAAQADDPPTDLPSKRDPRSSVTMTVDLGVRSARWAARKASTSPG